ncbi:cupin domain-containing protein [Methylobacterium sp. E-065]|nr:cupin domain-containing protein [Methylobacterium sp. E-065]MCJ2018460.1 cupin domain-containing protein [Methylobacterium sp. E-065]
MAVVPDGASASYEPGPPNLPKGTPLSQVASDLSKPGLFVLRVKVPAGTVIAPQTHSKPGTLTILSASISQAHGRTLDTTNGTVLKTGDFVDLLEDMSHSLWTTDEPAELQVSGSGPFRRNLINPADDSSRRAGGPG